MRHAIQDRVIHAARDEIKAGGLRCRCFFSLPG